MYGLPIRMLSLLWLLVTVPIRAFVDVLLNAIEFERQSRRVKKIMLNLTPEQREANRPLQHFNCRCAMVPYSDLVEQTNEDLVEKLIESIFGEET